MKQFVTVPGQAPVELERLLNPQDSEAAWAERAEKIQTEQPKLVFWHEEGGRFKLVEGYAITDIGPRGELLIAPTKGTAAGDLQIVVVDYPYKRVFTPSEYAILQLELQRAKVALFKPMSYWGATLVAQERVSRVKNLPLESYTEHFEAWRQQLQGLSSQAQQTQLGRRTANARSRLS